MVIGDNNNGDHYGEFGVAAYQTRPSALGMSDPFWGPLIHIFVDEKKKCKG